ncbi:MAG: Gfo/Idh/MocA family oxidoreductase, partial [Acidobacteriaceae bacterium]
ALYDIDRDRAGRISREFGIAKVCGSVEEVCGLPELDAIDVVTPEHLHLVSVMSALEGGKHVFVEKPFALDLRQCKGMIDAAASANRIIMVGQVLRFETKYAMLKDEVAGGRLGKIVSMHARRNRPKSLLPRYGRTHPALENCIHDIDLMHWYTQSRVKRVRGYGRSATGSIHHDTFWGMLEFESGAIGVVETIWLIPSSAGITLDDSLEIIGDAGIANIRLVPASFELWLEDGPRAPDVGYDPRVAASARGALREELAYFCDCVRDNRPPLVIKADEAMAAVEVALALVESARLDKEIEIGPVTNRNI